jgi:thiamine-monophosphate kinase
MQDENNIRTELSELGEFRLIDHLTEGIKPHNNSTIYGIGDDAAVIDNGTRRTLVSTDLLIESVHFDLTFTPLKHLGYKAAAVNFSDIAAMNGTPRQLLIGLSVSNRFSVEALDEFYAGLRMACERYKVDLVGGDTTTSVSGLMISGTVIGDADPDDVTYRHTANVNDLICVSGDLGGAYMGLLLLEREKQVFKANPEMQPDLDGYDYILERQLKPEPRLDIIKLLKDVKVKPTAMIDISDGLASEILHICTRSKVGCVLYEEKIPIDPSTAIMAVDFNISPITAAMNGGEDYELLFTVAMSDYEVLKDLHEITIIGHITAENAGVNLVAKDGVQIPIEAQGWNHMHN